MINIDVTDKVDKKLLESFSDLEKIEGIVLYCEPPLFKYEEDNAYTESTIKIVENKGFHYVFGSEAIEQYVPNNKQIEHLNGGKKTFIERALYQGETNKKTVSMLMLLPEKEKYEDIEKKTIKFIANFLLENELTTDNLMRGFDLNKLGSPLHLVDKIKWTKFINLVIETFDDMKKAKEDDKEYDDSKLEKAIPTYSDKAVRAFYMEYGEVPEKYCEKHEPDHRNIKQITEYKSNEAGEIKTFTTENNNNFAYTVVENMPTSSGHCSRAFDTLAAKVEPSSLNAEPIYPDIAVPPGGTLTLVDSVSSSINTSVSSVPLSSEEFEKRQQSFNINDHKDAVKKIEGKPVNNNDPFPVDEKIKELESHTPKVKVDSVSFNLHDCNHPDSVIGPAVAKNFAMIQDQIITISKRTERRLVKLENVMSTVMRNLFRASSRMNINCVYYGGQDVFGKYKCIRCLHNDRINDGQSMTLDQCLSCTRYEPIIGQVYAILDDAGTNIAQVIDDMQMGYMNTIDYSLLTRGEIHTKRDSADLSINSEETPKPFSELWEEGFKMDWNPTPLENQRPNIAEYDAEGIEPSKQVIEKENEEVPEEEFKDKIEENEATETLAFDSDDYTFDNFGTEGGNFGPSGGSFGMGATEIRNKILAYAENALKLCKEGKAGYSQAHRYKHLDKALNGISYWDCSSLVQAAYESAGITGIGTYTGNQYPNNLPGAGGIIMSIDDESKALPGDMIWFTSQTPKPKTEAELISATVNKIGHVGIYIGNGEYIHSSTDKAPLTEQIKRSPTKNWDKRVFALGRPKALVEADSKASQIGALGEGFFNYDSHQFNSTITGLATKHCAGQVDSTLKSVKQYGYGPALVETCKKYDLDPYLILGLIATESSGNPTNRTGGYWGIMQTAKANTKATSNLEDIKYDIDLGCAHFVKLRGYLKKPRRTNPVLAVYTYNAGNGTVDEACDKFGAGVETVLGGPIAQYVADAAIRRFGPSKQDECTSYLAKIILRANELRAKNALG